MKLQDFVKKKVLYATNSRTTFSKKQYFVDVDEPKYTVLPVKSDSDVMFCLQIYQGLRIDISLVY